MARRVSLSRQATHTAQEQELSLMNLAAVLPLVREGIRSNPEAIITTSSVFLA